MPAEDEKILPLVQSLAPPTILHAAVRAGITNEDFQVYREVVLYNLLEMLEITAKLNTVGYRLDPQLRQARGRSHGALFSRKRREP